MPTLFRDLVRSSVEIFVNSRGFSEAAALAYYGLLSLIPFAIVAASVLGFVLADVGVGEASVLVGDFAQQFLPFLEGELRLRLLELVESRAAIGLVGIAFLATTSAIFFMTIEEALSQIFQGGTLRSFWHSRGLAMALIPAVFGLLVFLYYSLLFADVVVGMLSISVLERLFESEVVAWIVSTAILAIEFSLVVYWFEGRRVRLYELAAGTIVFCSLWTVARFAFTFYVQRLASFSVIYGSLGTLVALIVWFYYASLVFLLACCFIEALRRQQLKSSDGEA